MTRRLPQRGQQPKSARPRRSPAPDVPATRRPTLAALGDHPGTAFPAGTDAVVRRSMATHELVLPVEPGTSGDLGLAAVLIELAGAQHGDLRAALVVWQREQDRLVNRAWRRPGGLTRPAGL
jgi:hypothetical protein